MSGFMMGIIGLVGLIRPGRKAERVPTVLADVLRISAPFGQEVDEVTRDHADGRMADLADLAGRRGLQVLQETVAAEAGVFLQAIPGGDVPDPVPEHAAQVADLLLESGGRGVRVVLGVKQQRMPALPADVFMAPVAVGKLLVVVLAEETRQRVTDARDRAIFSEVFGSAAAPPAVAAGPLEDMVIDVVSPKPAGKLT
jgi:hypothetical protein